jgi:hypothetical protein
MSDAEGSARVVLRDLRDAQGTRFLEARRREDGGIVIEGQDRGRGVEVFGPGLSEYEWEWTIAPDALPSILEALGGKEGDDPLPLLAAWCAGHGGVDPGSHLRDAGVPIGFWSRVGD